MNSLHFLLTYQCTEACDHCFVYGGPKSRHSFDLDRVRALLGEAERLGTVDSIYFEGGEPFIHYDLLLESVRAVRKRGWSVGIVTNAFWARTPAEAEKILRPLASLGIADLTVSDDQLHGNVSRAEIARTAAAALGIPTGTIHVDAGRPGSVMYRGRAAEKLAGQVPHQHWSVFTRCPHEQLDHPERVHVDALGCVHLCQGLVMGNWLETPLTDLIQGYDPMEHPIAGPLLTGGPAELARVFGGPDEETYADACHLCYAVRSRLRSRYPRWLAPGQVYGDAD